MAEKHIPGLRKIRSRGELGVKAYKQLKDAIIQGNLSPGQRLQEELITERIGISRTPLREALNRLNSEGLIEIVPKRGAHVVKLSAKELDDLFEVRQVIETTFLERAAEHIKPEKFQDFKESFLAAEEELADAQGDYKEWDEKRQQYLAIDRAFHDLLISSVQNKYWEQLYFNLRNRIELYGGYISHDAYWFPVAIKDHHQILDLILEQKYAKAQKAMAEHIKNVRRGLSEINAIRVQV